MYKGETTNESTGMNDKVDISNKLVVQQQG